jgi:hypothetical protein
MCMGSHANRAQEQARCMGNRALVLCMLLLVPTGQD